VRCFHTKEAATAGYENVLSGRNDRSGLRKGSTTDKFSHIVTIRTTSQSYIHHESSMFGSQANMSHVSRRPVSTSIPDATGTYTVNKPPRPRSSRFGFRSTLERSDDDDMELQHLLSPSWSYVSEDPEVSPETDIPWASKSSTQDDLQNIISGNRESSTDDCGVSYEAFTIIRPHRKLVHALKTLIRDIDQQDHIPARWRHVRPWLLSATHHTPRTRRTTANSSRSITQLEVPPAVRRYLDALRHGSWDDDSRKAARTVRTWVGYDVIAKSVVEVDEKEKSKATDDVWHSWWAV